MDATQFLLHQVVAYGRELHVDDDATWYAVTPGDVTEYGGTPAPIGLQLKISCTNVDGRPVYALVDVGTYNR